MRLSRKLLTTFFVYAVIIVSSGTFEAFLFHGNSSSEADGSPAMQLVWACFYLLLMMRLLPQYPRALAILKQNKAFVAMIVLTFLSTFWSLDASITLRKSVPLIFSALIGVDFACRYTLEEQLRFAGKVLPLVLTLGVICQVFFPGFVPATDFDAGSAWHGIAPTKNAWARLVVLTGVVILCRPRNTQRERLITAIFALIIIALTVASRALGGLVILVAMLVLVPIYENLRWKKRTLLVAGGLVSTFVITLTSLVLSNFDALTRMAGKDATMTGRIPIWRATLVYVFKRPLLGYGYAAFWSRNSRPGWLIREEVNWLDMPHSHNGYIEIMLAIGLVGLALYFYSYFLGAKRAALYIRTHPGREAVWPLACITLALLYQITESSIVSGNYIFWILYSGIIFSLGAQRIPRQSDRQSEASPESEIVTVAG